MLELTIEGKKVLVNKSQIAGACKVNNVLRITFATPIMIWDGRSIRHYDFSGKSLKWFEGIMRTSDD